MVTLEIQKFDISCCWIAQLCSSCNLSDLHLGTPRFEYRPGNIIFFYFSWCFLVPPNQYSNSASTGNMAPFRIIFIIHATPYHLHAMQSELLTSVDT